MGDVVPELFPSPPNIFPDLVLFTIAILFYNPLELAAPATGKTRDHYLFKTRRLSRLYVEQHASTNGIHVLIAVSDTNNIIYFAH